MLTGPRRARGPRLAFLRRPHLLRPLQLEQLLLLHQVLRLGRLLDDRGRPRGRLQFEGQLASRAEGLDSARLGRSWIHLWLRAYVRVDHHARRGEPRVLHRQLGLPDARAVALAPLVLNLARLYRGALGCSPFEPNPIFFLSLNCGRS